MRDIPTQVDHACPLAQVAVALADAAHLTAAAWQQQALVLNPPALAPVALALLAEIHGRCGYFVPLVHVRPVEGVLPLCYEIAGIVDLHALRGAARQRRSPS